ncbi:polyphosphate polymerase domain-containing protein [Gulosibacter chungangensis]|uniref:Polyphosphate polymerase domain-containing protein n=1 Tax=Gulosibacter chungangensis TaxID=979746 RepID=A0A7J5B939_9MICO|nr:polyphosphate polymerase domain-containing protein [Gulosibacter chungangensis]
MRVFETISLEELNAQAALQTRIDRKYVLPTDVVQELLADCPRNTKVLQINDRTAFRYESTYFDTPEFDSYYLAAHKHRRRYKVRTRRYVDTGGVYLEVKLKGFRGATEKKRIPLAAVEDATISSAGQAFLASEIGEDLIDRSEIAALRPCLHNSYLRTTQLLPDERTRFTVDLNLEWRIPASCRTRQSEINRMRCTSLAIVETKSPSGGGISSVDQWLWHRGYRPDRMSKFAAGLAALRPDLHANRWTRSLRQLKEHSTTYSPQPTQLDPITVSATAAQQIVRENA